MAGIEGARHVYKNHKKAKKRLNKNHPPQTPAQSSITDLHDKHLKEKEAL